MIQHAPIYEALNIENFRGSLKEAYRGKTMLPAIVLDNQSESDSVSDFNSEEEVKTFNQNGQMVIKQNNQVIMETNDEIKLRGRRPYTCKQDKATALNF